MLRKGHDVLHFRRLHGLFGYRSRYLTFTRFAALTAAAPPAASPAFAASFVVRTWGRLDLIGAGGFCARRLIRAFCPLRPRRALLLCSFTGRFTMLALLIALGAAAA